MDVEDTVSEPEPPLALDGDVLNGYRIGRTVLSREDEVKHTENTNKAILWFACSTTVHMLKVCPDKSSVHGLRASGLIEWALVLLWVAPDVEATGEDPSQTSTGLERRLSSLLKDGAKEKGRVDGRGDEFGECSWAVGASGHVAGNKSTWHKSPKVSDSLQSPNARDRCEALPQKERSHCDDPPVKLELLFVFEWSSWIPQLEQPEAHDGRGIEWPFVLVSKPVMAAHDGILPVGENENKRAYLRPMSAFCSSSIWQRTVRPANGPVSNVNHPPISGVVGAIA